MQLAWIKGAEDSSVFSTMPKDMISYVFGYLTPQDLNACSRACKVWKKIANVPLTKC